MNIFERYRISCPISFALIGFGFAAPFGIGCALSTIVARITPAAPRVVFAMTIQLATHRRNLTLGQAPRCFSDPDPIFQLGMLKNHLFLDDQILPHAGITGALIHGVGNRHIGVS